MQRIHCRRCIHYFVTWQQGKPHGCKAYGFKSHIIPSQVIKRTTGSECQFFTLRPPASS